MPIDNPFSRFLRTRRTAGTGSDPDPSAVDDLDRFASFWDEVETLVIQVYKSGRARKRDRADWHAMRAEFAAVYAPVSARLTPCWQGTKAAGIEVDDDPFRTLMAIEDATGFIDRWSAMQQLPAAREALNRCLLDHSAPM